MEFIYNYCNNVMTETHAENIDNTTNLKHAILKFKTVHILLACDY